MDVSERLICGMAFKEIKVECYVSWIDLKFDFIKQEGLFWSLNGFYVEKF